MTASSPGPLRTARAPAGFSPRPRLPLVDIAGEAFAALSLRPTRTALTSFGTVVGVAAFVGVLGVTNTAAGQISDRFTSLAATEVQVQDAGSLDAYPAPAFPPDADARIARIDGVVSGGVVWPVGQFPVSALRRARAGFAPPRFSVLAMSPGALTATRATLRAGRSYDDFAEQRELPVAMVGRGVANQLAMAPLDGTPTTLTVGGVEVLVIGIIDDVQRRPDVLLSVVVPASYATAEWGPPPAAPTTQMLVETRHGAATVVAAQLVMALRPDDPDRLAVVPPPDPRQLRDAVGQDLRVLFTGLAALSLLVGTVGIANTMLVSVLERVPEIGLRRALGARGRHIAAQFLLEGALVGGLGGSVGTAIGVLVLVVVSVVRQWTPLLEPWVAVAGLPLGAVTGLVAATYPAVRAAAVQPARALRS